MMFRTRMFVVSMGVWAGAAGAQSVPDYGFEWATIGDPGNSPYDGGTWGHTAGRGQVDYAYRIARMEVTTGQWMEYVNTFSTREGGSFFSLPRYWGAEWDPTYSGPGVRWRPRSVPDWDRLPVAGISWHEAARYANWLHNGRSPDPASLEFGAYDTSTWGVDPITRQRTDGPRLPGAKFWIPSLDEWLKAVHYDPDRHGPGEKGWWLYPHMSDEPPVPGRPGEGQTMAGLREPGSAHWNVPLGAYPDVRSPWGLLDASGGATEWLEEWVWPNLPREHWHNGAAAGDSRWPLAGRADVLPGSSGPHLRPSDLGVRLASAIPAPGTSALAIAVGFVLLGRRIRAAHGYAWFAVKSPLTPSAQAGAPGSRTARGPRPREGSSPR